jgi:hypothetical protein
MTALGIALLSIGTITIIVGTYVPSLGMLGGPGVVALAAGSVLAVRGLGGGLMLGILTAAVLTITATAVLGLLVKHGSSPDPSATRGRVFRFAADTAPLARKRNEEGR